MINVNFSPLRFLTRVNNRIKNSYSISDIALVIIVYFLMLWWVLDQMSYVVRVLFMTVIIITALYACSEEPK